MSSSSLWVYLSHVWGLFLLVLPAFASPPSSKHWAFAAVKEYVAPTVVGDKWSRTPIDRFILQKLYESHLAPASRAEPRTLIRRIAFDLTGLPPAAGETDSFVTAFENDPDKAVETLIDRLLASAQYGERWGRWWLDVARYADTNGQDENKVMANAWRYRDWVVNAFNGNIPFSEFIIEQLAGDLLPKSDSEVKDLDRKVATGFLVLGPKMLAEQDKPKLVMDIVDEQIDTVGRAFLGLTLGCARCHDHKFDPVPTRDYYALAGIFKSTRTMADLAFVSKFNERVIAPKDQLQALEAHENHVRAQTNRINALVNEANKDLQNGWKESFPSYLRTVATADGTRDLGTNIVEKLRALADADPATNEVSRAVRELVHRPEKGPAFLADLEHGTNSTNRAELRRAFFGPDGVFSLPKDPRSLYKEKFRKELVRLEGALAELQAKAPHAAPYALAVEDDKPVTVPIHVRGSHLNLAKDPVPRGFIEAIQWCGEPIRVPEEQSGRLELARWITHPENPLTSRVIVNRVWQAHFGEGLVRTADNFGVRGEPPSHPELLDWLSREFIRLGWDLKALHRVILQSAVYQQSSVAATAEANLRDPENRLLSHFPRQRLEAEMIRDALLVVSGRLDQRLGGSLVEWKNNEYFPGDEAWGDSVRRTIYLPIVRDRVYDALTIFDFANPSVCSARRTPTVVPHQALFFLNSSLVKESAAVLAQNILSAANLDAAAQVRAAYLRVLDRPASADEITRAVRFLGNIPHSKDRRENTPKQQTEDFAAFCQVLLASNEFVYRF